MKKDRGLKPSVRSRLMPPKPRAARLYVKPSPEKKTYKIPKRPSNGIGVGP